LGEKTGHLKMGLNRQMTYEKRESEIKANVPAHPITALSHPAAYLPNAPPQLKAVLGVKNAALTLPMINPVTR
jgi:hypothetical protein